MVLIHDSRIPLKYLHQLGNILPEISFMPLNMEDIGTNKVYKSIRSHPDIHFFQSGTNSLICSPEVSVEYIEHLKNKGVSIVIGERPPRGEYPNTIRYNAVRIGDSIICNKANTDRAVIEFAITYDLNVIDVKQGYSRCSVVPVDDSSIITADRAICRACRDNSIEVLLIDEGEISLPGEKCGFIGGSCGKIGDNKIVFLGEINNHPSGSKILDFISARGIEIISLKDISLYDAGSLIFCV